MTKEEQIIAKMDGIVEMYKKSIELSDDECFSAALLDFTGSGIHVFRCIYELAEVLGCKIEEKSTEASITYKEVKFFQRVDMEDALRNAQERIKVLEAEQKE